MLACAKKHEAAAKELMEATKLAGALDLHNFKVIIFSIINYNFRRLQVGHGA